MSAARLFDAFDRTSTEPLSNSTPMWEFLNTSALPEIAALRQELEGWLSQYPTLHRNDLAKRFRGEEDGDTRTAYFELFLHEVLRRLGCTVEVHPRVPSNDRRPDFRVVTTDESAFYLEAAVAYDESKSDRSATKRIQRALDTLNELGEDRVTLAITLEGTPRTSPRVARFRSDIERWLSTIDLDALQRNPGIGEAEPIGEFALTHDGWKLTVKAFFSPRPRGGPRRRPVGVTLHDIEWVQTHLAIRAAVKRKATHYGNLELPYVVAVGSVTRSGFRARHGEVIDALFGDTAIQYSAGPDGLPLSEAREVRVPNGAWQGPNGPVNTRVSACLFADQLWPWGIRSRGLILYQNPWAARPYESVLCRLPHVVPNVHGLRRLEGLAMAELFPECPH